MGQITIDQAMQIAVGHHQGGRLAEAEGIYRQVLAQIPDHADALHLLGVLAGQVGRPEVAIELITRAITINPAVAAYHSNLGESCWRTGQWELAIASSLRATELNPELAEAHCNLGNAHRGKGQLDEAIGAFHRAIQLRPELAEAHCNLGIVLKEKGRLDEAISAFNRAIELKPNLAEAHANLGNSHREKGQLDEAISACNRAIELRPDMAEAHNNLGNALKERGQPDLAIAACNRAIELRPDYAEAHGNLGNVLKDVGRLDEAISAFNRAIELKPDLAEAHANLGNALKDKGRLDEAISAYNRAIAFEPDLAEAHANLGNAQRDMGRLDEAISACRRAIALKPHLAEAHNNLGNALKQMGRPDEASAACRRAIALRPDLAEAHNDLGNVLKDQGRLDEALVCFRRAAELDPNNSGFASNVVYHLNFHPDYDAAAILAEHRRWAAQFAEPLARFIRPHTNEPSPDRRLRIGYVSPDLRHHALGYYMLPLFREHDHRQFEIVCYADVIRPDALTHYFQDRADVWRNIVGQTDLEVSQLVRDDRIDVLVDLTMHMARNRLPVFARKPAPVQVTFAAYPGTTGLPAIDYRLTDPHLDPPGEGDASYAEESVRLPDTFWCYDPLTGEPAVNPLPARANGFVTFGCLNNIVKCNGPVLALWAEVLRTVEGSRLLVLSAEGSHRRETLDTLEHRGVAPDRVAFVAPLPRLRYLEQYHGIDLVLDTFPYNGHTTSLDALWMGVPVITLVGRTAVGRGGLSQLTNLGLTELAATTPEEFVRIAVELAGNLPRLDGLRATLRDRMQNSPLMDSRRFTQGVEAAYRTIWRRWAGHVTNPG